jgi:thymidine kinase
MIEVITGCMFSGKTEELLRRINRCKHAKKKYKIFKPLIDDRYSVDKVVSHSKRNENAIVVKSSPEILENLEFDNETEVIFIDEGNFFSEDLIPVVKQLDFEGTDIIINGLDKDYRGEPFKGAMPLLLAIADKIIKLTAICTVCGNEATYTQKMTKTLNESYIEVGGSDMYEARCRKHHVIL